MFTPTQQKWILKYLLARLTQMWGWWPERRAVLNAALRSMKPKLWECAGCGALCEQGERDVDHIEAVGKSPKTLEEFLPYMARKLCGRENLRVLCKARCHRKKTRADGVKRRTAK